MRNAELMHPYEHGGDEEDLQGRPISTIDVEDQTVVSEVTLRTVSSLFGGPFYPQQAPSDHMDIPDEEVANLFANNRATVSEGNPSAPAPLPKVNESQEEEEKGEVKLPQSKEPDESTSKEDAHVRADAKKKDTILEVPPHQETKKLDSSIKDALGKQEQAPAAPAGVLPDAPFESIMSIPQSPAPTPRDSRSSSGVPGAHAVQTPVMFAPELPSGGAPQQEGTSLAREETPSVPGLSVATPMDESSLHFGRPRAQQVDPAQLERQARKKLRERRRTTFGLLALSLVVLGVVLGIGLGFKSRRENDEGFQAEIGPTLSPSFVPTSAPTTALDLFLQSLPESTLDNIYTTDTPQEKAYSWLANHPNIAHLPEWRMKQMFALSTFFYAFQGPHWPEATPGKDRWMDVTTHECSWVLSDAQVAFWADQSATFLGPDAYGYQDYQPCNGDGELQTIILSQLILPTNIKPTIPPEIELLTSLRIVATLFSQINTKFSDFLVPEMTQLPNLTQLNLQACGISGTIPEAIALMTGLKHVLLGQTQLSGLLPSQIGKMTSLEYFSLGGMEGPNGNLPSELGLLTSLTLLAFRDTNLMGTIPSELGLLTNMEKLVLSNNALMGSIPSELLERMTNLYELSLGNEMGYDGSHNNFTGSIPQELWALSHLEGLFLGNLPDIQGSIPTDLIMPNIAWLRLEGSPHLSGTIPEEFCFMEKEPVPPRSVVHAQGNALDFDCSDLLCGCKCQCSIDGSNVNGSNTDG